MYKTVGSANEELMQARDKAGGFGAECREQSSLCQLCLEMHLSQQRYRINIDVRSRGSKAGVWVYLNDDPQANKMSGFR